MNKKDILDKVNQYKWYHRIKVADDIYTAPAPEVNQGCGFTSLWDFIIERMGDVDFSNKKVLDIGCRDGLFSFEAERRGAAEIIGIDNDISLGAKEFLIPHFRSKVNMHQLNLYDLSSESFGKFDIILLFGVLYHLRYPFWGLKKVVDCLADEGLLLIESGMIIDQRLKTNDFLYCPVEKSPYEFSSCTFFNREGLSTTLKTFGCNLKSYKTHDNQPKHAIRKTLRQIKGLIPKKSPTIPVARQFLVFQKDETLSKEYHWLTGYWDTTHNMHTDYIS